MSQAETPNDTNRDDTMMCIVRCHLERTRLGKHERAILLAHTETWALSEAWEAVHSVHSPLANKRPPLSRAIWRLERLKLIEVKWCGSQCIGDGEYICGRQLRLTPLGVAVVEQFRDALASGKRIRWARFDAPDLSKHKRLKVLKGSVGLLVTLRALRAATEGDLKQLQEMQQEIEQLEREGITEWAAP
jgi:hypothetical protein